MKIAWSVSHTGLLEMLASLFPEHEFTALGVIREDMRNALSGQEEFRPNMKIGPVDLNRVNISEFDLLIELAEANGYNNDWRHIASMWKIPRIYYITNPGPYLGEFKKLERFIGRRRAYGMSLKARGPNGYKLYSPSPYDYWKKCGKYPIVFSSRILREEWKLDGRVIHNTAPKEWERAEYVGDIPKMLFGKNGYYTWAKPTGPEQIKFFSELEKTFGDKLEIHDSSVDGLSEKDWIEKCTHYRCWFDHDFGSSGRALCQGLVKAMAIGMPVFVWKTRFSEAEGLVNPFSVHDNMSFLASVVNSLLDSVDEARIFSKSTKGYYKRKLSNAVIRPQWEEVMEEAVRLHGG